MKIGWERPHRLFSSGMRPWLPLGVASATQLLVVLDVSVVNVALPSIQRELGMADRSVQWVVTAYTLVFAGGLLVGGRAADLYGVRRTLIVGLGIFVAASAVAGVAGWWWLLIAARAAQGLGAAAASPAGFALVITTYPAGMRRTRAMGVWTAVGLAGAGFGNVVSGTVTDLLGWRAVFLVAVPLGVIVMVVGRQLPLTDAGSVARVDLGGLVVLTAAMVGAIFAVTRMVDGDYAVAGIVGAGALVIAILTVRGLLPVDSPVPWHVISREWVGNGATCVAGLCFQSAFWLFLSYALQGRFSLSPLMTGVSMAPVTVTMAVSGVWLGPWVARRLPVWPMLLVGAMVCALGFAALAVMIDSDSSSLLVCMVPVMVIGLGGGLLNTMLAIA